MHHPIQIIEPLSSVGLADDITEQEIIRQRRRQLQALYRARNEFIAISSHQLRTPATCVKQYLAMILEGYAGEVPEHLLHFLQKAYDNNEKQLALLATILQVAAIDSGEYEIHPSVQNACDIVKQAIEACHDIIAQHSQNIIYSPPADCFLVSDPEKIKIVLVNLIENASNNSPRTSVIKVSLRQSRRYTRIRVSDNGVGIAKENLRQIFQKFTHIENEHVDTVNGNGLGLYISRSITRKLGGTLTVHSEPRQGSTFTLTFPTKQD